jgi:hypothetical protein
MLEVLEFENIKNDPEKLTNWLVSVVKIKPSIIENQIDAIIQTIVQTMFV